MGNDLAYMGLPYVVRGEPPQAADCWTLVRYFLRNEMNIRAPRYYYSAETLTDDSTALITMHTGPGGDWREVTLRPVDLTAIQRGDLLVMTVVGYRQHTAVALGGGEMLHTLAGRGSTIEPLARWANHIDAALRWRGQR